MIEALVRPRGPYSLRLTARGARDATRTFRDEVLTAALSPAGAIEIARAWQGRDGLVRLQAESEAGLERLRFTLAVDDDH